MPNGYGSVSRLTGKRRRPYCVRTACKYSSSEGKQGESRRVIGYYATKKEALEALADYNRNPYDLSARKLTFAEVYDKWKSSAKLSENSLKAYTCCYNKCLELADIPIADITLNQLQEIADRIKPSMQQQLRKLLVNLYKYSCKYDITSRNIAEYIETEAVITSSKHHPFTGEEISALWESDSITSKYILIMIYSGWRITELLQLKESSIDPSQWIMTGGIKTAAGRDRVVPVHHRIQPIISSLMTGTEFLIDNNGSQMNYQAFRRRFDKICPNHTPHDTRHTFVTNLQNAGADKLCIQKLVGHSTDVTDDVYTHKTVEDLRKTVELLK